MSSICRGKEDVAILWHSLTPAMIVFVHLQEILSPGCVRPATRSEEIFFIGERQIKLFRDFTFWLIVEPLFLLKCSQSLSISSMRRSVLVTRQWSWGIFSNIEKKEYWKVSQCVDFFLYMWVVSSYYSVLSEEVKIS